MTFKISQSGALITDNFVPHNSCESQLLAECRHLRAANAALADALQEAIPWLVRLGDFIGNGELTGPNSLGARCDVILQARAALAAHKEG